MERGRDAERVREQRKVLRPHALALLVSWVILTIAATAATAFEEYLNRIEQAAQMTAALSKYEEGEGGAARTLATIKEMLPTTEDIQFGQDVVHVDNLWLHQAINDLSPEQAERKYQIAVLAARLEALAQRLRATRDQAAHDRAAGGALLERILARPEYQPEEKRESIIQQYLARVIQELVRLLAQLFPSGSISGRAPGPTTLNLLRLLILLLVSAALIFGGIKLARYFNRRASREEKKSAPREVLGEQLAEDLTAEELLKEAVELAREGDYRNAIRRAYIAILYELEQRGKLRLHRSKTNHDYLRELGSESSLYPIFAYLTGVYERAWYGHARTTVEDYSGFMQRCREVAG